jgi:multiple sugar transport system permease protein
VLAVLVLGLGAVLMVAPFLWMLTTSLRSPGKAYDLPPAVDS